MWTVLLAACGSSTEPIDTDLPGPIDCETISGLYPPDGATQVPGRTPIHVDITFPDDTLELRVSSPDGAVAGSGRYLGNTYVWEPDQGPLQPSAAHGIEVAYCSQQIATTFTTSGLGAAVAPSQVRNRGYGIALDASAARFLEPVGLDATLKDQLHGANLLVQVDDSEPDLELRAVSADPFVPDQPATCGPVYAPPPASFSENPTFDVGPARLRLITADGIVSVEDARLSGTFGPTADGVFEVALRGTLDLRDAMSNDDLLDLCTTTEARGGACIPCDDSEEVCLPLWLVHLTATDVDAFDPTPDSTCP